MPTRVLVAYASHHGATAGIAERIAATLERAGLQATARHVEDTGDLAAFDAFVIGSAVYMFHWLKEASSFVRRNRATLAAHPVWLFSSGPLGTSEVDANGRSVRLPPRDIDELTLAVRPRAHRVFFGAYDPAAKPIGIAERVTRLMPAARDALPAGDFRDWAEIDAWAWSISEELNPVAVAEG